MRYFVLIVVFLLPLQLIDSIAISKSTSLLLQKQSFSSTSNRVALLELYTSEGCSSCPPADRWFSQLKSSDKLWKSFVPISLHVDYWDYIGWKDRFASKRYSQRLRQYAKEQGEHTVYTPGVRVGGQEFRSWRRTKLDDLDVGQDVGILQLDIEVSGTFIASFSPKDKTYSASNLHIALLGMDLVTDVKRGENRGKKLQHDFVVLDLKTIKSRNNQFSSVLPLSKKLPSKKQLAVAAWVDSGASQTPIQAVGGFLKQF